MIASQLYIVRFKILISVRLITDRDKHEINFQSILLLTFKDLLAIPLIIADQPRILVLPLIIIQMKGTTIQ
jgi:hypothetical protein